MLEHEQIKFTSFLMLALSGILLKNNRKDTTGDSPSCWLPGKVSSAFLNWPFVSIVPECHRAEATFHYTLLLPFSRSVLYYYDRTPESRPLTKDRRVSHNA